MWGHPCKSCKLMENEPTQTVEQQITDLKTAIGNIQATLDQVAEDMANDRKDIGLLLVRVKNVENLVNLVIQEGTEHAKELIDNVEDKIEEMLEPVVEVNDRLDQIANSHKKVVIVKERKRPWYKRLFSRG